MIPLELTLKNFLSYQEASLNFRGLHTACICGSNGSGKSSLLEAITWVIWGKSRAATDDDVIHVGSEYVRVDFQFISNQEVYRIIRNRNRGRNIDLQFQIESLGEFRTISEKGIRATQEKIISYLKLDYDTFVNSAYLRQGRADEFMLRRPNERKKVLADLLNLNHYQELAEQSKDLSKQYQGQAKQLELNLEPIKKRLSQEKDFQNQQKDLDKQLEQLQQKQEQDYLQLQLIKEEENQRKNWLKQFSWQQQQCQNLTQDIARITQEQDEIVQQLNELQKLLDREDDIDQGYQKLQKLQKQEKQLANQFKIFQEKQQQRHKLEKEIKEEINKIDWQIHQKQTQLETLEQQEKELKSTLAKSGEITLALEQLNFQRKRLKDLDKLQHKVAPLLQRKNVLYTEIEKIKSHLEAKLEQLYINQNQSLNQIDKIPKMRQYLREVDLKLQALDRKEVYQQRIKEKGQEKNEYQERIRENQRIYQEKIEELQHKLKQLEIPDATCPLCEQALDEIHRHHVINKTQTQQQETQDKMWMLQEQMSSLEKELNQLREEYKLLQEQLANKAYLEQEYGQIEAQLENISLISLDAKKISKNIQEIEQSLASGIYAVELQSELTKIDQELQKLDYDEQTHALVRGDVERFRWAEIKQSRLEDASNRHSVILQKKPHLIEKISNLHRQKEELQNNSDLKNKINQLEKDIKELGYENNKHQELLDSLRESQSWQLKSQQLQQAKQQLPQLQQRYQTVAIRLQYQLEEQAKLKQEINTLSPKIESTINKQKELTNLEKQIQDRRQKLDDLLAKKGRIAESIKQLADLAKKSEIDHNKLQEIRKKYRVYQELAKAFGKNGIQALMIENILPQLEAETNQILSRLTGNQLHIKFVTQKSGRSGSSRQKSTKLIDTLDILIADANMTRSYETYSGGEAFRINFSIRLALAKLLAQQAGTALQMLIIDEGFGTQDTQGCERLIGAINAIASDFSCILAVTHMPQFKEAFQNRIEVQKNSQGSQLYLVS
ncbi:MAG TPA: ATP-binding cassette family protein [Cyanothece sp. UBA12306]|nr:ATP-binding cassette family protein [Cyanothece sp. UBA12306]